MHIAGVHDGIRVLETCKARARAGTLLRTRLSRRSLLRLVCSLSSVWGRGRVGGMAIQVVQLALSNWGNNNYARTMAAGSRAAAGCSGDLHSVVAADSRPAGEQFASIATATLSNGYYSCRIATTEHWATPYWSVESGY